MHNPLLFFSGHLLVHLLSCPKFFIELLFFLFFLCFVLLLFDQCLDHSCLGNVLMMLVMKQLLLLLLLCLGNFDVLLHFVTVSSLVIDDFLPLLLFLSLVQHCHLSFLGQFHLQPDILFVLSFHVSSSLLDNIPGLFSSLIDFLVGPKLLLF